jgi:protein-disulfide isomerase
MRRTLPVLALVAALGGLAACEKSAGEHAQASIDKAKNEEVDPAFGQKVRAYLIQNPEVLIEASMALEQKQAAESAAKRANVGKMRRELERDNRDFVVNPKGRVTLVVFYDYNCGFCKKIAPEVVRIARENPEVRVVFKDFTLGMFGPTSEYAAAAARLLNQKGVFLEAHAEMMDRRPLTDAMVDDILRRNGIDPADARKLEQSESQKRYLADQRALAGSIGLEGTPAFVIGDVIIPGADENALQGAVSAALRK